MKGSSRSGRKDKRLHKSAVHIWLGCVKSGPVSDMIHDVTGPRALCKDGDHNPISVHPIWPCRSRKSARISPSERSGAALEQDTAMHIGFAVHLLRGRKHHIKLPAESQLWRMSNVKLVSGSSPFRCFPVYFPMLCLDNACRQTVQPVWDVFDTECV